MIVRIALLGAVAVAILSSPATRRLAADRRHRPRPRSAGQSPDGADRAGLADQEDQGRRRHERRRLRLDRGAAQPRHLASRSGAPRAGRCAGDHDAHAHRGNEHRKHRARRNRESRRRDPLPPHSRGRRIVVRRARYAHAAAGSSGGLDGRRPRAESCCGPARAAGARSITRVPGSWPAGAGRHDGIQLGGRPGDPRRGRVHDEPDRGQGARDGGVSAAGRRRHVPWSAAVPRSVARTLLNRPGDI